MTSPTATSQPAKAGESVPTPVSCEDEAGDSSAVLDLTRVDVDASGDPVTVTYGWKGTVSPKGSVLWVLWVNSADGGKSRQLGYKIVDGRPSAHFVFDFSAAQQQNLHSGVQLDVSKLVVEFPRSAVADLGEGWTWLAVLNVDGNDADECRSS